MNESILFLGKFDENLLLLEEQVLTLQKKQNLNQIKESEYPDVIKYKINGYQSDAWVIIGDVKPTLLLKELISKTKIIIFVFNLTKPESLTYLLEGWLPIIEKVDKNKPTYQQRILIGTNSEPDTNRDIILEYFQETMKKFGCNQYYEDGPNMNSTLPEKFGEFSISTDLFKYLKGQLTKEEVKDEVVYCQNSYVVYKLSRSNKSAKVIESPKAFGKITIPSTIKFKDCEYTVTDICDNAFKDSQIIALTFLPDSKVYRIGDFAFENSILQNLFLPASLIELGKYWCGGASKLLHVEIDEKNNHFQNIGRILYHINQIPNENTNLINYELLFVPRDYPIELIIRPNVSKIGSFALYNCFGIKKIAYKTNMIDIDEYSFSCLSKLSCIEFECNELFIGNFSFASCESLSSISFQNLLNANIGMSTFDGCTSLKEISFNSLYDMNIESYCFNEAIKLQKINLFCRDNLILGDFCFRRCSSLSTVSFNCPKNAPKKSEFIKSVKIGNNCFEGCTSLSNFTCENVYNMTINKNSFKGCIKMNQINIKNTKSIELDDNCFSEIKNLNKLFIQSYELLIKGRLFNENQFLTSIFITTHQNLTITKEAFNKCNRLNSVIISSDSTLTISKNNFLQLAYLETLELYGNEIIIEDNCFNKCVNIFIENYSKDVFKIFQIKSNSLIEIGKNCFNELLYLNSIEITSQKVIIHNSCFNKCISLSHCIFSESSKILIGNLCFNECNNLSTISFSNLDYIEIDSESFIDCNALNEFNIKPSNSINPIDYFCNFQNFGGKTLLQTYLVQLEQKSDQFYIDVYLNDSNEFQISFFRRMILLSRLNYLGILPLIGFGFITVDKKCYPSIMRKNSKYYSLENYSLTGSQKYIILLGLMYGIKYLHALKISITNLKLNNVYLDDIYLYPYIFDYCIFFYIKANTKNLAIDHSKANISSIYSYLEIAYELITGKSFNRSDVNSNLTNISDPKIKELFRRIFLFDTCFVPPSDDIFEYIKKNKEFKKLFSINDEQIFQYLDLIEKSDISNLHINKHITNAKENVVQSNDGIVYRLIKDKTAEIISYSNNAKGDVFIPKCIEYKSIKYEIKKICEKAFVKSQITSISFSMNSSVSMIDNFAFSYSTIQKLFIPASLIELGQYWSAHSNLRQIEIDSNNSHFFKEKDIIYYTNVSQDKSQLINEIIFIPHNWQNQINISSKATRIGSFAFQKCNLIQSINIESDSIIIDSYSFYQCEKVTNISLFQNELLFISNNGFIELKELKSLGIVTQFLTVKDGWIKNCPSLEIIVLNISNGLQLTPGFFNKINSLSTIKIITQSSLSFMTDSFYYLTNLVEIEIKAFSFSFDGKWINNCPSLQKITIDSDNDLTITQMTFCKCKSLNSIKIQSSSKIYIFDECFVNSKTIQKVILNGKDVTIGKKCFMNCNELSSIIFLNVQNLKIGSLSFYGYLNFTNISIVASNKIELDDYCFSNFFYLQTVAFNCKELKIGKNCFMNCYYLKSLSFENLQNAKIESYAFYGCNSLFQFNISVSSKLTLCNECFYGTSNLMSTSFTCNIIIIGDYVFNYCNKLENVKIRSKEKNISKIAYCTTYGIRFNLYYD